MTKYFITLLLSFIGSDIFAQIGINDTILVLTDKNDVSITQHYVVNGSKEMVIYASKVKRDTTFYDNLCEETAAAYDRKLYLIKLRQLPVSKINANQVFSYFNIGDSIEEVTKRLGNKKIHITPKGYEVSFYNSFSKKHEVFEFTFWDGKLSSMSRAATNSLPTNDVWLAFNILPLKEDMNNLEALIKKLRNVKSQTLKGRLRK